MLVAIVRLRPLFTGRDIITKRPQFATCRNGQFARRARYALLSGRTAIGLKRLVVAAYHRMLAHEAVDDREHLTHARFGQGTFDDDDQLGLVGRRADQAPSAVVHDRPHTVDRDEIDDGVAADRPRRIP